MEKICDTVPVGTESNKVPFHLLHTEYNARHGVGEAALCVELVHCTVDLESCHFTPTSANEECGDGSVGAVVALTAVLVKLSL